MTTSRSVRRLRSALPVNHREARVLSFAMAAAVGTGALAAMALLNRHLTKKAERDNPACGRFIDVNGVERGSGETLVLLHGNGSMIPDFESSNLIDLAATNYRVIAPVVIIAGEQDKLIDIDTQSARLHSEVSQSRFHRIAGNGHMIQQTATDEVMAAIKEVADACVELAAAE